MSSQICHGCCILAVRSWLSHWLFSPCCSFFLLSWLSSSSCPVLCVLIWLSAFQCPVWLCCSDCPVRCCPVLSCPAVMLMDQLLFFGILLCPWDSVYEVCQNSISTRISGRKKADVISGVSGSYQI